MRPFYFILYLCIILSQMAGCNQPQKQHQTLRPREVPSDNLDQQKLVKDTLSLTSRLAILDSTKLKILQADTILLISHKLLDKYKKYEDVYNPQIVENGRPNKRIIRQQKVLNDTSRKYLANLLGRLPNAVCKTAPCFNPHHAILLFRRGAISVVNLCFECHTLETSPGIHLKVQDFDEQKWADLKSLFLSEGISQGFD